MKPRVLIAEANRSLCDIYRCFISGFGCQVETVQGGLECVAKLPLFRPDVLVLDLQLPWGGADGVLAWLCEASKPPAIPAVILIGDAAFSSVAESILIFPVVRVYHQKPILPSELLEAVINLAQNQGGQGPVRGGEEPNHSGFRPRPDHAVEEWDRISYRDLEYVEVPLLMPGWQLAVLDRAADRHGLTTGQLLRQLIGTCLADLEDARVRSDNPCQTEQKGAVWKGRRG